MAYISEREPTCYMRIEWDIGRKDGKEEKRKASWPGRRTN